ncbi:MAG: signal peptidase II [Buchnera aphidicola (Chaetogeoica yunlongensis)]
MKISFIHYRLILLFFIIFSIVSLDRISKNWITKTLSLYDSIPITKIINIFYVRNYGIAFNILSNNNIGQKYLLCSICIISILILFKIMHSLVKKNISYNIPYTLIVSGAIGNLIDRFYFGYVIDFIDLHIQNQHFATFNIADISIFLGAFLFLLIKN